MGDLIRIGVEQKTQYEDGLASGCFVAGCVFPPWGKKGKKSKGVYFKRRSIGLPRSCKHGKRKPAR